MQMQFSADLQIHTDHEISVAAFTTFLQKVNLNKKKKPTQITDNQVIEIT